MRLHGAGTIPLPRPRASHDASNLAWRARAGVGAVPFFRSMKRRSLASFAWLTLLAVSGFAAAHCGGGAPPQPYGANGAIKVILPPEGDGGFYAPTGCSYSFNPSR